MKITLLLRTALAALLAIVLSASAANADSPQFRLGFKALADQIPEVAGVPVEDEHYGANGDSLQQTTTGLMAWRKADNWTAFTNGSQTWVNGPYGVQERANDQRFPWEASVGAADPAQGPIYVDSSPSDFDITSREVTILLDDGSCLVRVALANVNHYWTARDISVTVILRDAAGQIVMTGQATSDISALGPLQRGTWEYAIPPGVSAAAVSSRLAFRWVPAGQ